jgi:voltage-gated potassium channel
MNRGPRGKPGGVTTLPDMSRVEAWERRTEPALVLLAVMFFVAYAWTVLDPDLPDGLALALHLVRVGVWALFALDLGIRLTLVDRRGAYLLRRWYDVAFVLLPVLRPLLLIRYLVKVRINGRRFWRGRANQVTTYVLAASVLLLVTCALAVLNAERDAPDATIRTFGESMWWAMATVTTAGYGDYVPVTTSGRLVGVVLMVTGIGMLGSVTAAVAAWFMEKVETAARPGSSEE